MIINSEYCIHDRKDKFITYNSESMLNSVLNSLSDSVEINCLFTSSMLKLFIYEHLIKISDSFRNIKMNIHTRM